MRPASGSTILLVLALTIATAAAANLREAGRVGNRNRAAAGAGTGKKAFRFSDAESMDPNTKFHLLGADPPSSSLPRLSTNDYLTRITMIEQYAAKAHRQVVYTNTTAGGSHLTLTKAQASFLQSTPVPTRTHAPPPASASSKPRPKTNNKLLEKRKAGTAERKKAKSARKERKKQRESKGKAGKLTKEERQARRKELKEKLAATNKNDDPERAKKRKANKENFKKHRKDTKAKLEREHFLKKDAMHKEIAAKTKAKKAKSDRGKEQMEKLMHMEEDRAGGKGHLSRDNTAKFVKGLKKGVEEGRFKGNGKGKRETYAESKGVFAKKPYSTKCTECKQVFFGKGQGCKHRAELENNAELAKTNGKPVTERQLILITISEIHDSPLGCEKCAEEIMMKARRKCALDNTEKKGGSGPASTALETGNVGSGKSIRGKHTVKSANNNFLEDADFTHKVTQREAIDTFMSLLEVKDLKRPQLTRRVALRSKAKRDGAVENYVSPTLASQAADNEREDSDSLQSDAFLALLEQRGAAQRGGSSRKRWGDVVRSATDLGNNIADGVTDTWDAASDGVNAITENAEDWAEGVAEFVEEIADDISDYITECVSDPEECVMALADAIEGAWNAATDWLLEGFDYITDSIADGVTTLAENTWDSVIDEVEELLEPIESWWTTIVDSPLGDAVELIGDGFGTLFTDTGCTAAGGTMISSGISVPTSFDVDWDNFKLTVGWQELEYCELGVSEFLAIVWSYDVVNGIADGCEGVASVFGADDTICSDVANDVADVASSISVSDMRLSFGSCSSDWSMGLGLTVGTSLTVVIQGVDVSVSGGAEVGLLWGCDGATGQWAIEPFWAAGGGLGFSVGNGFDIGVPSIGLSFHHRDKAYGDFYGLGTELTLSYAMLSGAIAMSAPAFDWCEDDVKFEVPEIGVSWTIDDVPFVGTDNVLMTKHPSERNSNEWDPDTGTPKQCSIVDWYVSGYDVSLDLCDLPDLFTKGLACIIPEPDDFQDAPIIGFGVGYASTFAGSKILGSTPAALSIATVDTGFHVTMQGSSKTTDFYTFFPAACSADTDTHGTAWNKNIYGNEIGVTCCDSMGSATGASPTPGAATAKNYDEAEAMCEAEGMVLCSVAQIEAGAVDSGTCMGYRIWTRDGCEEGSDPSNGEHTAVGAGTVVPGECSVGHITRQGNGGSENFGDEKVATCQCDSDVTSTIANDAGDLLGVQCCIFGKATRRAVASNWDCTYAKTYDEAEAFCQDMTWDLCTLAELEEDGDARMSLRGGCSMDGLALWTKDECTNADVAPTCTTGHITRQGGSHDSFGTEKVATCQCDSDTTSTIANDAGDALGVQCYFTTSNFFTMGARATTAMGSCWTAKTYEEAEAICGNWYLGSLVQVEADRIQGDDCDMGGLAVWTRETCTMP